MPPDRRFKFNNQRFFLTYAHLEPTIPDVHQGNISGSLADFVDAVRIHLFDIPELHWVEAVTELHEDGVPHLHCVVVCRKR